MSHRDLQRHGLRPSPFACVLVAALLPVAGTTVAQPPPPISGGCHPVPPKAKAAEAAGAAGVLSAALTGKLLRPGGSRRTLGTSDDISTELQAEGHLAETTSEFTLDTAQGPV